MRTGSWLLPLLIAPILFIACGNRDDTPEIAAAIGETLAAKPPAQVNAQVWADTHEFYARRENVPAWPADGAEGEATRADEVLQLLRRAKEHGLDPSDYGEQELVRLRALQTSEDAPEKGSVERAQLAARTDVRLTTALLSLGRDIALGRTKPGRIDSRWKARRTAPDFVGTLTTASTGDLSAWLDTIKPRHAQYAALQKALANPAMAAHASQIVLNLERWRWMPDDFGDRYIIVNIPSFHLEARQNGQPALEMRVVVGTPENKTPIFSDMMSTTVFSPYWNVPESIVEGETAPAAARDPNFLKRNNMEILRVSKSGGGTPVDPATVNWDDPEELKSLAFRQKPGDKNALGHVKFLFPNPYDVYLHDTPADLLFARRGRAFSHGCVRVEQPEALARWVLQDSPEWDDEKIVEAMHAGDEKHVKLKQEIPVHIVYFTAWADDAGTVRVDPDVYGYDAKQSSSKG
jgi:murein L,D-transpeptidase YcbB/YkuD